MPEFLFLRIPFFVKYIGKFCKHFGLYSRYFTLVDYFRFLYSLLFVNSFNIHIALKVIHNCSAASIL